MKKADIEHHPLFDYMCRNFTFIMSAYICLACAKLISPTLTETVTLDSDIHKTTMRHLGPVIKQRLLCHMTHAGEASEKKADHDLHEMIGAIIPKVCTYYQKVYTAQWQAAFQGALHQHRQITHDAAETYAAVIQDANQKLIASMSKFLSSAPTE